MKQVAITSFCYFLLAVVLFSIASKVPKANYEPDISNKVCAVVAITPTPYKMPTFTPTPTPTPLPTPAEALQTETASNQQFYDMCVARGMVTPANDYDDRITAERGGYMGPSGRETYYNLRMDNCINFMRELGYDEEEYPYWIRDDGAKMLGLYVMCAANWKIRPKGTIIPTSLGDAIVVDTGEFVADFPYGVDLATDWR